MTGFAVEIDGFCPLRARSLAASRPASVRLVEQGGEVVLMGGRADWPERLLARIRAGQKRFVLSDPQACAAGQLADLIGEAEISHVQIRLCETHADNPAVAPFRSGLTGHFSAVTITGQGEEPIADMLMQQLRLARAAGFEPQSVVHGAAGAAQAIATLEATFGEDPVFLRLTVARSRAGGAWHRLLAHGRVDSAGLHVWSDPDARPATAFHLAGENTTGLPSIYESAHRAILRFAIAMPVTLPTGEALRQWDHDATMALAIAANS